MTALTLNIEPEMIYRKLYPIIRHLVFAGMLLIMVSCQKENSSPQFISSENLILFPDFAKTDPWLRWDFEDSDGDFLIYDLYISENNPPDSLAYNNLADEKFQVKGLKYSTTYYWKVIAEDDQNGFAESDIKTFKTRQPLDFMDTLTGTYSGQMVHYYLRGNMMIADTIQDIMKASIERYLPNSLFITIDSTTGHEAVYNSGGQYPDNYFEYKNGSPVPEFFIFEGDYVNYYKNYGSDTAMYKFVGRMMNEE